MLSFGRRERKEGRAELEEGRAETRLRSQNSTDARGGEHVRDGRRRGDEITCMS